MGLILRKGVDDGHKAVFVLFSPSPRWKKERAMEEQGIIKSIIDCGSVVSIVLDTTDGTRVLAADGNMFRRAQEAIGRESLVGLKILFEETADWPGGLASFSLAEDTDEGVYCPNCRRILAPHLNPDFCVFGKHPLRNLPPTNGAHR